MTPEIYQGTSSPRQVEQYTCTGLIYDIAGKLR